MCADVDDDNLANNKGKKMCLNEERTRQLEPMSFQKLEFLFQSILIHIDRKKMWVERSNE